MTGVGVFLVALVATAWALQVRLPARTTARASIVVDENGDVVFGAKGAKVELMQEVFNVTVSDHPVVTVPLDKAFILTDIDGVYTSTTYCELRDSTGLRLRWPPPTNTSSVRSYSTGLRFAPGETVTWQDSGGGNVGGQITFMGKFVPAS